MDELAVKIDVADEDDFGLRDARRRRIRDFVALYNAVWYRDFPIAYGYEKDASRAMWTTHIASVVKQCADLMGLQTRYETGGRTDAIIQKPVTGVNWARLEWEWAQAFRPKVNEFEKLARGAADSEALVYIGYSEEAKLDECLHRIQNDWAIIEKPLIVFIITYRPHGKRREFRLLQTYEFKSGSMRRWRAQPALPWQVKDTKWEAALRYAGAKKK